MYRQTYVYLYYYESRRAKLCFGYFGECKNTIKEVAMIQQGQKLRNLETCAQHWGGRCKRLVSAPNFDCGKGHLRNIAPFTPFSQRRVKSDNSTALLTTLITKWESAREVYPYLEVQDMFDLVSPYRHLAAFSAYKIPFELERGVKEDVERVTDFTYVPSAIHPYNLEFLSKCQIRGSSSFYKEMISCLCSLYSGKQSQVPLVKRVAINAMKHGAWSMSERKQCALLLLENFPSEEMERFALDMQVARATVAKTA